MFNRDCGLKDEKTSMRQARRTREMKSSPTTEKFTEALFKINIDVSDEKLLGRSKKSECSVKRNTIEKVFKYSRRIVGIENTSKNLGLNCITCQRDRHYLILLRAGGC
jgi:hypothetical protein